MGGGPAAVGNRFIWLFPPLILKTNSAPALGEDFIFFPELGLRQSSRPETRLVPYYLRILGVAVDYVAKKGKEASP